MLSCPLSGVSKNSDWLAQYWLPIRAVDHGGTHQPLFPSAGAQLQRWNGFRIRQCSITHPRRAWVVAKKRGRPAVEGRMRPSHTGPPQGQTSRQGHRGLRVTRSGLARPPWARNISLRPSSHFHAPSSVRCQCPPKRRSKTTRYPRDSHCPL
jgi:hypothetical protein